MRTVSFETLPELSGTTLQSAAMRIGQDLVDQFVELSGDRQWIHCDTERAAAALPGGVTIVPGGLLLALLPRLLQQIYEVTGIDRCFVAAYRQVKFHRTLATGSAIALKARFQTIRPTRSFARVEVLCEIIDTETGNPVMSATVIDVFYPAIGGALN